MMPAELPIACSLDSGRLSERLGAMAELGRDALVDAHLDGRHARLWFAARRGIRARVEAIAEAEARCCAFLQVSVSHEPGTVRLTIDAPEGAEPVLAELAAAFGDPRHARR
jgi:hypothetical protein